MQTDDPFRDHGADPTIVRPRPGAPRGSARPADAAGLGGGDDGRRSPASAADFAAAPLAGGFPTGINSLLAAAGPLIALAAELKRTRSHPDTNALFRDVCNEIRRFGAAAQSHGEPLPTVNAARFVLCTMLDEVVLNTPFGSRSEWMSHTLLSSFHDENYGGEKVFDLLERLLLDPSRNLHLLELIYVCIALGFEGKYRQMRERGRLQLGELHKSLHETIRAQREHFERPLSPRWQGLQSRRMPIARYLPLWVLGAVTAGALVLTYLGFAVAIGSAAEDGFDEVVALTDAIPPLEPANPYRPVNRIDLRQQLRRELQSQSVEITVTPRGQLVTLAGDGTFASGSAQVQEAQLPTMLAVADALALVDGQVVVIGHTDDVPSRSLRYPSNLVLSEARANAVLEILSSRVTADRLTARGMGDTRPVVPNDSALNRARNRRVEILLAAEAGRE